MKRKAAQQASQKIAAIANHIVKDKNDSVDSFDFDEAPLETKPKCTRQALKENHDNQPEVPKKRGRKKKIVASESEEDIEEPKAKKPAISDYEQQVLKNIEERKKLFEMIVGEAKAEFMESVAQCEPLKKPKAQFYCPRTYNRKTPSDFEPGKYFTRKTKQSKVDLDSSVSDVEEREEFEHSLPLLERDGEFEKLPVDLQDFLKPMQSFNVSHVALLAKTRIVSLAWHPSELFWASGHRNGSIGFWRDGNLLPQLNDVHLRAINCLTFDIVDPTHLFTSSADGCLINVDITNAKTDILYSKNIFHTDEFHHITHHAQKDASTLLFSQSDGAVALFDIRSKVISNSMHCFEKGVNTLSIHPQDENLFMTCNRYGKAGIYDMRNSNQTDDGLAVPVVELREMTRGVHSAYFSPLTGNFALTTNADGCLVLYDVANKTKAKCVRSIENDNGSYSNTFKAVWHPKREDIFICGSADHRKKIEVYQSPSGQLMSYIADSQLKSACGLNAFHPNLNVLASTNSCGRVHIFCA